MNGLLVLNKPSGITSRQVVDRAERRFPGAKIGHAGTLDPLATGVLVLCLGDAARLIEYIQDLDKTYAATIRLGAWSDTDDSDGAVQEVNGVIVPERSRIIETLDSFVGEIEQTPPAYSAARVDGRRAHDLARRGRNVRLQPRRVRIDRIELISYAFPTLELLVECGKGTYIRSLARSLGERLGCGALVASLDRTRVGPFQAADAIHLTDDIEVIRRHVLPLRAAVAHFPAVNLPGDWLFRLSLGEWVPPGVATVISGNLENRAGQPEQPISILNDCGDLAAIALLTSERALRPRKVFKSACPTQAGQGR
jgi:tRNA pseudouridine55 synthase